MKKLMEKMAEELSAAFEKAGYDPAYGKVTVSNRPDLCEYQCNGAMAGAKAYKKAPFMIADDVVAGLEGSEIFSMAEVVKPGFINLKVKEEYLAAYLEEMAADEKLSVSAPEKQKVIMSKLWKKLVNIQLKQVNKLELLKMITECMNTRLLNLKMLMLTLKLQSLKEK